MQTDQFLELTNVSYSTDSTCILQSISFVINKGEFVSIVGQSGIGKTTILKLIAGLKKPSSGTVLFSSKHINTSFVFQTPSLLGWKNVLENVLFPLSLQQKPITQAMIHRAKTILSLLEIQGKEKAYPHELSEGQKQRVSLARALITKPSIILMDEPFASLDAMTRERLQRLLWSIWKKEGITIVFVTHSISEATLLSQKIIVLDGSPAKVHDCIILPKKQGDDLLLASPAISNTITSIRKKVIFLWKKKPLEVLELTHKKIEKKDFPAQLLPFLTIAGLGVCYEIIRRLLVIPSYILPSPTSMINLAILWYHNGMLWQYSTQTAIATLGGFFLALPLALVLGFISAKNRTIAKVITPLLVALQVIPIIAYAPILIIWFGLGMTSKIYTACLIAFFPLYMNTVAGIQALPSPLRELKKLYKTKLLQGFVSIDLPYAFPYVFSGLQVAATFSLVGAVVGEFMGGNQGLGHLISLSRSTLNTAGVFVCITALWFLGAVWQLLLLVFKKAFSRWANYSNSSGETS
jgi:NitT/TauT family transport system ATP-binding protein